jgi:WbqC-like protein family
MIFAMHQPNYLPWLGYFAKLASADRFVVLDVVQYPRGRSFAARNRIKTAQGPIWLTIPVSLPSACGGRAPYADVLLADASAPSKHLRTLEMAYGKAAHGPAALELYEAAAVRPGHTRLVELNITLIEAIRGYLGLTTPLVRLSSLCQEFGRKSALIADIARALDAKTYLSGDGSGRDYNDEDFLRARGIDLRYLGFGHPTYPQLWGDFQPQMCILDAIANCGRATTSLLQPATGAAPETKDRPQGSG